MENQESPTFRVRRVPAFVTKARLPQFLINVVEEIGPEDNIHICSLAATATDFNRPASQTATLQFLRLPSRFSSSSGKNEWVFPVKDQKLPLLFDLHFLGFTVLNEVFPESYDFDFIALSGLASHPFGSWKKHGSSLSNTELPWSFMWLRDQLPGDFPNARVMIYGYDTMLLKSESFQTIDDLALSLISQLKSIGKAQTFTKPTIFFAHSLGGIILKRALCYMAESGEAETFMLQKVRMVLFFGVPSKGMAVEYMLPMVDGQPNKQLVEALSTKAKESFLSNLDLGFSGIAMLRDIRLVSAFETRRTRIAVETSPGRWKREGPFEILVSRESAIQSGTRVPQDCFPIDKNHSDIVKLSEDDLTYGSVAGFLREVTAAPRISLLGYGRKMISQLWATYPQVRSDKRPIEVSTEPKTPSIVQAVANGEFPANDMPAMSSASCTIDSLKQSLAFPEIAYRAETIEPAHRSTFQWLFDKEEIGLSQWLQHGSGLFWIKGKAGSGKSTLMKYLRHFLVREPNLKWQTQPFAHIEGWFFFHDRGSYLQKSLEGLLRTIILQMIHENSDLARIATDAYGRKSEKLRDIWTTEDLISLFTALIDQDVTDIHVTLFIDALDEFAGFPEDIAKFLASIVAQREAAARTTIRICFSSRPWDAFLEAFSLCPGFRVEEYTTSDIQRYTTERLSEIEEVAAALDERTAGRMEDQLHARHMIDSIVKRSEGVFLWVRLAVDQLITSGDSSPERLESILAALPAEFEGFYDLTMKRIPPRDRYSAFILLELVLRSMEVVDMERLLHAFSCAKSRNFHECVRELSAAKQRNASREQISTKLNNLCGGLLELTRDGHVQFIHHTAKEYVGKPGLKHYMLSHNDTRVHENGYSYWLKYLFAALSSQDHSYLRIGSRDGDFIGRMCHAAEASTGRHCAEFLDTVPELVFEDYFRFCFSGVQIRSRMSFAILADLRLYVEGKLSSLGRLGFIDPKASVPILHLAVRCAVLKGQISLFSDRPSNPLAGMVRLLISRGAPIDSLYQNMVPFQALFYKYTEPFGSGKEPELYTNVFEEEIVGIAEILLEAGQSPDAELNGIIRGARRNSHISCRALHISLGKMTRILLQYGADVNALDSEGNTPLDYWVMELDLGGELTIRLIGKEVFSDGVQPLVQAGGCFTKAGYLHWQALRKRLREISPTLVALGDRAPVLPDPGMEKQVPSSSKIRQFFRLGQKSLIRKKARADGERVGDG